MSVELRAPITLGMDTVRDAICQFREAEGLACLEFAAAMVRASDPNHHQLIHQGFTARHWTDHLHLEWSAISCARCGKVIFHYSRDLASPGPPDAQIHAYQTAHAEICISPAEFSDYPRSSHRVYDRGIHIGPSFGCVIEDEARRRGQFSHMIYARRLSQLRGSSFYRRADSNAEADYWARLSASGC